MNNLIKKLKQISDKYPLSNFNWDIPSGCPIQIPSETKGAYEKNVFLKENFQSILENDKELSNHYWLIQKWGGIGTFKKSEKNDERIKAFIKELPKGKLTRRSFECISSLSKVASFINPKEYTIYDSRAIYSLNWLLFNHGETAELFPQPLGRNSELTKYDLPTIVRLTKDNFTMRKNEVAFHQYCELLKELAVAVYGKNSRPYKLEMLLFSIAPSFIVKEIESSVSLTINIR